MVVEFATELAKRPKDFCPRFVLIEKRGWGVRGRHLILLLGSLNPAPLFSNPFPNVISFDHLIKAHLPIDILLKIPPIYASNMTDNLTDLPVTPRGEPFPSPVTPRGEPFPSPDTEDNRSQDDIRLEQFATLYAMGEPIPKALQIAGYTTHSSSFGYRLLHHPDVIAKVDEVRQWRNEKLGVSISDVLAMLQRDRDFAHQMSNSAAAIQASSMIGKILGALDPATTRTPTKITIEWGDEDLEAP